MEYDESNERFFRVISETPQLWQQEPCPRTACGSRGITCHDHSETRAWRFLDIFGKRAEVLCNVPRGRCPECRKVYRVKAPWEGCGKYFGTGFEGFALALMREIPVIKAADIIQETDQRMWRMLFAHVEAAYAEWDRFGSNKIPIDLFKGHLARRHLQFVRGFRILRSNCRRWCRLWCCRSPD